MLNVEEKKIVAQKLIKMYEKKLSKVLTTSPQFGVYAKLISELSIFGLQSAEARIVSGEEPVSKRKAYTQFLTNSLRLK